jgi:hypothetical protein
MEIKKIIWGNFYTLFKIWGLILRISEVCMVADITHLTYQRT